jgi:hypothetical protein
MSVIPFVALAIACVIGIFFKKRSDKEENSLNKSNNNYQEVG